MPWCPKCKAEYRDGFTKCNGCECELVNKLEDPEQVQVNRMEDSKYAMEENDVETFLISARDELEASMIEAKLNQACIPIMKRHKETGGYLSVYMGMTPFGIDVYVPSRLLDLAREIVEEDEDTVASDEQKISGGTSEENLEVLENSYNRKRRLRAWIIIILFIPGLMWILIEIIQFIKDMLYS